MLMFLSMALMKIRDDSTVTGARSCNLHGESPEGGVVVGGMPFTTKAIVNVWDGYKQESVCSNPNET